MSQLGGLVGKKSHVTAVIELRVASENWALKTHLGANVEGGGRRRLLTVLLPIILGNSVPPLPPRF